MKFNWSKQGIEWFYGASEYTGFHRNLAESIGTDLSKDDTVCDFGCGLGCLDTELSKYVKHITAVDVSEEAIEHLSMKVKSRDITNIDVFRADARSLNGKWDIGIMSFFGTSGEDIKFYRNLCNKKLIRIVNMEDDSTLYPKKYRKTMKDTAKDVKAELEEVNYPYSFKEVRIEFGQPLSSYEDAITYVRSNAPDAGDEEIHAFLEEHMEKTERTDYPIYLPNEKYLGIFTIL